MIARAVPGEGYSNRVKARWPQVGNLDLVHAIPNTAFEAVAVEQGIVSAVAGFDRSVTRERTRRVSMLREFAAEWGRATP